MQIAYSPASVTIHTFVVIDLYITHELSVSCGRLLFVGVHFSHFLLTSGEETLRGFPALIEIVFARHRAKGSGRPRRGKNGP